MCAFGVCMQKFRFSPDDAHLIKGSKTEQKSNQQRNAVIKHISSMTWLELNICEERERDRERERERERER